MIRIGISSLVAMIVVMAVMASVGVALYGYVYAMQNKMERTRMEMGIDAKARCFYLANAGRWICIYRVVGGGSTCSIRFVCNDGIYNASTSTSDRIGIVVLPREVGKPILLYASCGSVSVATRVGYGYAR